MHIYFLHALSSPILRWVFHLHGHGPKIAAKRRRGMVSQGDCIILMLESNNYKAETMKQHAGCFAMELHSRISRFSGTETGWSQLEVRSMEEDGLDRRRSCQCLRGSWTVKRQLHLAPRYSSMASKVKETVYLVCYRHGSNFRSIFIVKNPHRRLE